MNLPKLSSKRFWPPRLDKEGEPSGDVPTTCSPSLATTLLELVAKTGSKSVARTDNARAIVSEARANLDMERVNFLSSKILPWLSKILPCVDRMSHLAHRSPSTPARSVKPR